MLKETAIGKIPKDWECLTLKEIVKATRGASPRPIDSPIWFDFMSDIGWVRISDISKTKKFLKNTKQSLSELGVKYSRYVEENSLIMSICATVGKPALTKIKACVHDGFVVFSDLRVEQEFLYYYLEFIEKEWSKGGQTGSQMNLNTTIINNRHLPIPPKEEQLKIAESLSRVDSLIFDLEKLVDKKKNIKQGLLQELLTGKRRIPEFSKNWDGKFKKTDVGEIPTDWDMKTLGDVGEVKMCKRIFAHQTLKWGKIPFYKIGTFGKSPDAYISEETFEFYKVKFSYPKIGDVLISAAGTIGRTVVYDGSDSYYQDSNIIWIDNKETLISNRFLYYILKIVSYQTEGGTIQRLYNSILKGTPFPCPRSKKEQDEITNLLTRIDNELLALDRKLEKYKKIKNGMMQTLLTGEIRLV